MRKFLLALIALFGATTLAQADGSFNFSAPETLSPTFPESVTPPTTDDGKYPAAVTKETAEGLGAKWSSGGIYQVEGVVFTDGNVTATYAKEDSNTNGVRLFYSTSTTTPIAVRMYPTSTLTVATTDEAYITQIVITGDQISTTYITGVNPEGMTGSSTKETWTGRSQSVTFTVGKSNARIYTLEVTTAAKPAVGAPFQPTFSLTEGSYYLTQSVEISADEGCDIFYTTDGNDPTTESTKYVAGTPVEISTTTTLKAIAVKDGVASAVASATYTILDPIVVKSIAEALAIEDNSALFKVDFDLTVGYCYNRNIYATDGTDFILIYPNEAPNPAYEQGTVIKGGWIATYALYNTYVNEFIPNGTFSPETEAGTFIAPTVAAADITADKMSYVLKVENVVFDAATPDESTTTTDFTGKVTTGETVTELTFRNYYGLASQEADTYDVTAIVVYNNKVVKLNPLAFVKSSTDGIEEVEAIDPTAPCEYYNLQGVRVAAENARGLLIVRQGNRAAKVLK